MTFRYACFVCVFLLFSLVLVSCGDDIRQGVVHEAPLDTNRLVKVQLAGDFDEPMEMAITDEGNVIIIERKGAIKIYNEKADSVKQISFLDVYSGQEDGLLGVALDPEYKKNNFIYLYYSPSGNKPIQRVSRFTLVNDSLQLSSEKVLLEIPTQRQECCHSAGSLAFGPEGNLFIAIGDNTNPHNPGYYNSVDERKGREYWDAQRTAGNTNDYRGKILRIHPELDGTYTIPKGNLFPKGTPNTKPEIYVMGCRNPYRISVDPKKGWLYWGDVGQNTVDDPKRGPISYDEWNLATEAGFFGWPYFAGPNAAYAEFDFATEKIGPFFDPAKPENNSVNNTGLKNLPPARSALIWYSYDESKQFPHLGTGGKSPIAGPVFYTDIFKERINDTTRHLHEYYNGKVFIAEWMRDWINVLTVDDSGRLDTIEPFMKGTAFHHPIELELGPGGRLYILEYGTNWFAKNRDAGLFRVEYLRGEQTAPANNKLNGQAANSEPEIYLYVLKGNTSFYWPNQPLEYVIDVTDKEDGSLQGGQISREDVKVSMSYNAMGSDLALIAQSHEKLTALQPEFPLINNSDCKACHSMSQKSVGPSYIDIAKRYRHDSATVGKLASKIIEGGSGAWGDAHAMSAHPQLSQADARQMVNFILSLKDETKQVSMIPANGKIVPEKKKEQGEYILYVSYNDKPQGGSASNSARKMFTLIPPKMLPASAPDVQDVIKGSNGAVTFGKNESWIAFRELDLTGITSLDFHLKPGNNGGKITLRLGVAVGAEAGNIELKGSETTARMQLQPRQGMHDLFFVYTGAGGVELESITFNK